MDVPEGKSLRCFLADQLGCNAKRISKKYERTGYNGKLQYVDKRTTIDPQELAKWQQKTQVLERKFLESRETLKIVEASRKRGPTTPSIEPATKRVKTSLLTSVSPHLIAGNRLALGTSLGIRPIGMTLLGGGSGQTSAMESLLLRRSLLQSQQQRNSSELVRASMLSALQKYGSGTTADVAPRPLATSSASSTLDPSVVGLLALQRSASGSGIH